MILRMTQLTLKVVRITLSTKSKLHKVEKILEMVKKPARTIYKEIQALSRAQILII